MPCKRLRGDPTTEPMGLELGGTPRPPLLEGVVDPGTGDADPGALLPGLTIPGPPWLEEALLEGEVMERSCMGEERGWERREGDTSPLPPPDDPEAGGGGGGWGKPFGDRAAAGTKEHVFVYKLD